MNTIRAFIKTYFGSLLLALLYLSMIKDYFQKSEVFMIAIVLFFANLLGCFAYFIGILWPFYFLLRQRLAHLTFNQAMHQFLIYFSIIPAILSAIFMVLCFENKTTAMQFSMMMFDTSVLIYLGFIYSLKNKTIV